MSSGVIVPCIDGVRTAALPRLTPREIIDLCEQEYVVQRARLLQDLEDAGAGPDIRTRELRELTLRREQGDDLVRSALGIRGATVIIQRSLDQAKTNGKVWSIEELALDPSASLWQTALQLIGVEWGKPADPTPAPRTGTSNPA